MSATISYAAVNDAINQIFFDGRFAGRPVYLSLDNEMRRELAGILQIEDGEAEDVICECAGKRLEKRGNPYSGELADLRRWKRGGMTEPPLFTGVLFCLSHAAAIMAAEGDFASNNYYRRLEQVTGIDRQWLTANGKSTEQLWAGLNDWLLENNYELGRPTARAINSWKYVGIAISQAVVRAGDRELFHDLFERYGFSGNEDISPTEMGYYLANWMPSSKSNHRLRSAWKNKDLQERVSEAAIAELAVWGSGKANEDASAGGAPRIGKLSLLASIVPKFPRSILEIHLGRAGDDERRGPFRAEGSDAEFFLANDHFGTFATISPAPFGTEGDALSQSYTFQTTTGGQQSLEWQPRIIIPFSKSLQGPFWVEVSRVAFGAPHLVLVRDIRGIPKDVEAYLAQAAIGRPTMARPNELHGLPAGWVLYKDVRVGQPPTKPSENLECLVPLGDEGSISISGGLQLLPGFYHSSSNLAASFVASKGPTSIEVLPIDSGTGGSAACASSTGADCLLQFEAATLAPSSGAIIKAWQATSLVDTKDIFLRNADKPSPLSKDGRGTLAYGSIASAQQAIGLNDTFVSGMTVEGEVATAAAIQDDHETGEVPVGAEEDCQDIILSNSISAQMGRQTCTQRGYHFWKCQTLMPGMPKRTPLEQRCKDCHQSLIVIDRGKKQLREQPAATARIPLLQAPDPAVRGKVDYDLLLDALCFLGYGTWGKFESLLEFADDPLLQGRQIAARLFLLGFIDLEIRPGSNSVRAWSVPGPALNFVGAKKAFLSGFRCASFVADLSAAVGRVAGSFVEETAEGRPAIIWVEGIAPDDARAMSEGIRDPLGRALTINDAPGEAIANACSQLGGLTAGLRPVSIGRAKNLQKFTVRGAKWINASSIDGSGAYRWKWDPLESTCRHASLSIL